jgi:hypothetical protein
MPSRLTYFTALDRFYLLFSHTYPSNVLALFYPVQQAISLDRKWTS